MFQTAPRRPLRVIALIAILAASSRPQQPGESSSHADIARLVREEAAKHVRTLADLGFRLDSDHFGDTNLIAREAKEIIAFVESTLPNAKTVLNAATLRSVDPLNEVQALYVAAQELRLAAEFDSNRSVYESRIKWLARLTEVKCCVSPAPGLRKRLNTTRISPQPLYTEPGLSARYQRYRSSLEKINPEKIDDLGSIYLPNEGREGVYRQILGGSPMLDPDVLQNIDLFGLLQDRLGTDVKVPGIRDDTLTYRFAPAYDVRFGYEIASSAERTAASAVLFGCEADDDTEQCNFLASTLTEGHEHDYPAPPHQISLCTVAGAVQTDAPIKCIPFVIVTGQRTWIAVVDRIRERVEGGGPEPGPSEPDMDWIIYSDRPEEFSFRDVFAKALAASPLKLQVSLTSHTVRAGSPQRFSKILSTQRDEWHEWISIVVEEEERFEEHNPNAAKVWNDLQPVHLSAVANLLVNKQNDDSRESWHPASGVLTARMKAQIDSNIMAALRDVCSIKQVLGDRIACVFGRAAPSSTKARP